MSNRSERFPPLSRRQLLHAATGASLLLALPRMARSSTGPVVEIATGRLQGQRRGPVQRFLGIPYAQSIAGANRFRPPQSVEPWTGVRQADRYADSSPQQPAEMATPVTPAFQPPDYVRSGDDCLALNVWAPADASGPLPVMVWLHGGGWTSGSGSCAIYDGENLARRGDVVVVTLNHRLGASGLTDLSRLGEDFADSANLGIRDMLAALHWVRDNIAAIGGDPDRVTIFGESGGGWKVATMLGVPAAKGLFHRAIIESGPLIRFMEPAAADEVAQSLLKALGISSSDPQKLFELDAADIIAAEAAVLAATPMSMSTPGFPTGFWPVLDGELIPAHVFDGRAAPSSLDVPLLIGQTGTEFSLFMLGDRSAYDLDGEQLQQRVSQTFGAADASGIIDRYRSDYPADNPSALWFRIYSDYGMAVLSSEVMDVRAVPGAAPVYAYRFNWKTPIHEGKLHSPHTIEIPFVFDNATTEAGRIMTGGGAEVAALADRVSTAWVNFARSGQPSAEGLPPWPAYSRADRHSLHIDNSSQVRPYIDAQMRELFRRKLWQQAGVSG
ncbi:MAG: carboxylesterase family protein [Lysobacterales bacterium]